MEELTNMDSVVNSITTALSSTNLWGVVGSVVPILAISVLFALGFRLIMKVINRTKKAK